MGLHGRHDGRDRVACNSRQRGDGFGRSGSEGMLKGMGQLFGRRELWIGVGKEGGVGLRGTLGGRILK